MAARRFEFEEGSSSKFWAVERDGRTVTVTFGRIGSNGQEKAKSFPDEAKAAREEERLIAEKVRKGYQEVTGGKKAKPEADDAHADDKDEGGGDDGDDEDDGEPKPPPRGFTKPTTWEAIADAWHGAVKKSRKQPCSAADAAAIAKALGIARLPPSYIEYLTRFHDAGELNLRYERENFPNYLNIYRPKDLLERRKAFLSVLETYGAFDEKLREITTSVSHLIPFGYDTSRTDICWDPSRPTPDGEMELCFYNHEYARRVDLGARLEDLVKYFKPGG